MAGLPVAAAPAAAVVGKEAAIVLQIAIRPPHRVHEPVVAVVADPGRPAVVPNLDGELTALLAAAALVAGKGPRAGAAFLVKVVIVPELDAHDVVADGGVAQIGVDADAALDKASKWQEEKDWSGGLHGEMTAVRGASVVEQSTKPAMHLF